MIGPLVRDETSDKKGFMTNTEATFAACIVKSSKNAMKIIKFLNWVYKNPENYNLCRYGIEGKHWVNNGDGTYSYPEGKDEYLVKSPYSGILTLVENQIWYIRDIRKKKANGSRLRQIPITTSKTTW